MLNQIILVGRLVNEPTIEALEDGRKRSEITLAVNRQFKNAEGKYETDFVPVTLYEGIAENTAEYCHKGDVIGVKGRLEFKEDKLIAIAEKVTFLSSKSPKEDAE